MESPAQNTAYLTLTVADPDLTQHLISKASQEGLSDKTEPGARKHNISRVREGVEYTHRSLKLHLKLHFLTQ